MKVPPTSTPTTSATACSRTRRGAGAASDLVTRARYTTYTVRSTSTLLHRRASIRFRRSRRSLDRATVYMIYTVCTDWVQRRRRVAGAGRDDVLTRLMWG